MVNAQEVVPGVTSIYSARGFNLGTQSAEGAVIKLDLQ